MRRVLSRLATVVVLLVVGTHTHTRTHALSSSSSFAAQVRHVASQLPSLRDELLVVKYGGNAMTSPALAAGFCEDVATLQQLGARVVVVHGGGPQINRMLDRVGVASVFDERTGLRVSSPEVVDVAEMVLCGSVGKGIAHGICRAGGHALSLSGRDAMILRCVQSGDRDRIGYVGDVDTVNVELLRGLLDQLRLTPVLSPIGCGASEDEPDVVYNVNADVAAGRVAGELGASRVLFLTDIAGVLDKNKQLLTDLSLDDVQSLIDDETITGGMIPKVSYAVDAVRMGVQSAMIIDGRVPHALLHEVLKPTLTEGTPGGTTITK